MNKYIEKLLTTLYEGNYSLYRLFNSPISYSDEIYNKFMTDDYIDILNEEFHISNLFDNVIDDIVKIYKKYYTEEYSLIYTGWNISYKNNKLTVLNLNNESEEYPIYIEIMYVKDLNTYGASKDKESGDNRVIIQLNSWKINDNISLLKTTCKHEFLHIREMYALEHDNILLHQKNKTPVKEQVFSMSTYESKAFMLCYFLSAPERRARINAFNEYLKIHKISANNSSLYINKVLEDANEIIQLNEIHYIVHMIMLLMDTNNIWPVEIFFYYCLKNNIVKTKYLTYSFVRKSSNEYTKDEIDRIQSFIFEILKITYSFREDLVKQICNI